VNEPSIVSYLNCIDYRFGYYDAQPWSQVLENFIRYVLCTPPALSHVDGELFTRHWFAFNHFSPNIKRGTSTGNQTYSLVLRAWFFKVFCTFSSTICLYVHCSWRDRYKKFYTDSCSWDLEISVTWLVLFAVLVMWKVPNGNFSCELLSLCRDFEAFTHWQSSNRRLRNLLKITL